MFYIYVGFDGSVSFVHGDEYLTEADKERAVLVVEEIPTFEPVAGKNAILKYSKYSDSLYWEYVDIPPDPEDEQLKQRLAATEDAILALLFPPIP